MAKSYEDHITVDLGMKTIDDMKTKLLSSLSLASTDKMKATIAVATAGAMIRTAAAIVLYAQGHHKPTEKQIARQAMSMSISFSELFKGEAN